jgi:uncharacterized membrane protein YhiD involved in acid resistance
MFDWLGDVGGQPATVTPNGLEILAQLLLTVLIGCTVALTYYAAQRRTASEAYPFMTTLVLLTVLVSMTTLIIGDSVARAFSLVGALSIVRFRTVVEDTRDTAFVIFAVVMGMAMGSGHLRICLLGVPVVAVTAIAMYHLGQTFNHSLAERTVQRLLEIRVGSGHDAQSLLAATFERYVRTHRLVSATTTKQGIAYDLEYAVQLLQPASELELLKTLNQVEGVQVVKIRET